MAPTGAIGGCQDIRRVLRGSPVAVLGAIERWMFAVLDLDPVRLPAGAVGAIAVLGNHSLESDQVCVTKQVRTDLASFERRN